MSLAAPDLWYTLSMKHLLYHIEESADAGRQFNSYFSGLRIGVLDIETTGLDRRRDKFVLGGLYDVDERRLHQIFAQNTSEEEDALRAFADLLEPLDVVITYNGAAFDMPFLKERAGRYRDLRMPMPYDIDLYRIVRRHSPLKRLLPNLKQKTVEAYMGLWQSRTDEIDGAESVRLYREYEKTQDAALEEKILLHNSDDVCQLTRLIKVVDKCDLHGAMHAMGFPVKSGRRSLIVEDMKIGSNALLIEGVQKNGSAAFRCYELDGYKVDVAFEESGESFSIRMPVTFNSGLAVVDIRAAGLDEDEFAVYPGCGSGFLVIKGEDEIKHRECNHLVRSYVRKIMSIIDRQEELWN